LKYCLVLYIILCSCGFWVGKELRIAQELYFQMGAFALIFSLLFFKLKPIARNKVNVCIGIFGIYSIGLFILGHPMGFGTLLNIFFGISVYFITLQLSKADTKFILNTIIWVALLNVIYIVLQYSNFDFIYVLRGPNGTSITNICDPVGLLGLKAVVGMWMGLGVIAALATNPIVSIIFLIPLYLSKCSGAVFGLGLSTIFYLYYTSRKWFRIVVPVALIAGIGYMVFIDNPMGMMSTRPPMWKMVMKDVVYGYNLKNPQIQSPFLRNPLTGFGLDSFRNGPIKYFMRAVSQKTIRLIHVNNSLVSPDNIAIKRENGHIIYDNSEALDYWDNPHNEFVQLFYEMGLIGIMIFGFIVYYLVRRFRGSTKTRELVVISSLLIMLFASGISQFPFHLARIGIVLPILLGLYMVHTND